MRRLLACAMLRGEGGAVRMYSTVSTTQDKDLMMILLIPVRRNRRASVEVSTNFDENMESIRQPRYSLLALVLVHITAHTSIY